MARKKAHKLQVIQFSPYRPVQWRYDRILELVRKDGSSPRPVRGVDDRYIVEGYRFIGNWERIMTTVDNPERADMLAELFPDNPALYYAYEIFLRPPSDHVRCGLEARILARQPFGKIAQALCVFSPETIEWYEKLFFNVLDRIDAVDYISKQVITPLVGQGISQVNNALTAKFFGYFGGETILEYMLHGIDRSMAAPTPGQSIDDYADSFFKSMLRTRSMVTAMSAEIDVYKVMPLLELHTKLIEEHNRQLANAGPKSQLEETVSALLGAIPWTVGQTRQDLLAAGPLGNYIGSAAEPRAVDLMKIAAGEAVPHLEGIKARRLPEPKIKRDIDEHAKQGSRSSDS